MSTNLATSRCPECKYQVRLSDVRGKPLEIRQSGRYAPHFGVRFDCGCGEVYFVMLRRSDTYWDQETLRSGEWKRPELRMPNGQVFPNREAGKFAFEDGFGHTENTGTFTLDLSYYGSFNDEKDDWKDGEKPHGLCEDNAEATEWAW